MEEIGDARFTAVEAGKRQVDAAWDHRQFNPFIKLYYITEGEGEVTAGLEEIRLIPGRLYLIPSHVSLEMRCRKRMVHYWVHLIVRLEGGLDILNFTGTTVALRPGDPETVEEQMGRIAELYPAGGAQEEMELQGLYRLLLARFMTEETTGRSDKAGMTELRSTLRYIAQNLASPQSNPELAALHHWHPTYFANRFAKVVGLSPRHYILRKRIIRAQELLTSTRLSLTEVATKVGFRNVYYFSRAFKKICGIPPGRYRKRCPED